MRPGAQTRALLDFHAPLIARARGVLDHFDAVTLAIAEWVHADERRRAREELEHVDVGRLGETTDRNLRLTAIHAAGYRTAADLLGVTAATLDSLPGVGDTTARGVVAAVDQLAKAAIALRPLRITLDRAGLPTPTGADRLLALLHRYQRLHPLLDPHRRKLADYVRFASQALDAARPARYSARLRLSLPRTRRAAHAALVSLQVWDANVARGDDALPELLDRAEPEIGRPDPGLFELTADFGRRSAEYYTALQAVAPQAIDALAARGLLPQDLADRVEAHPLDTSLLHVSLRGYQEFGARFVLEQGRVLLGDEMGLGKTVQALAAMTHLARDGHRRFLVVCPASLLATWEREVTCRSTLSVRRIHGDSREKALAAWESEGGVGLTTFDGLAHIGLEEPQHGSPSTLATSERVGLLVVDEAQQVKNPKAARSRLVARWAARCARVLLMSGTPMDNRLAEFLALIEMLHPGLSQSFPRHLSLLGPGAFRRSVAHVYLRRNQADVLVELPDVVASDDWVDLSASEEAAYRAAVASGNLMAMRQAAWHPDPTGALPAKLERLIEIVEEARSELRSTLVFSYFHATLDAATAGLRARGITVHGPLTGDVPLARRSEIVDAFTRDAASVLVAQVSVGGTGLNLQTASVVVLCEPQLTPGLEDQAVARANRMGQVHTVRSHRLLGVRGVDERIVEMLADKREVFDGYIRVSSLAQAAVSSTDVTRGDLARNVVAAEQARLGYGPWWDEVTTPGNNDTRAMDTPRMPPTG